MRISLCEIAMNGCGGDWESNLSWDAAEIYRSTDIGGCENCIKYNLYKSEFINPNIFNEKSQLSLYFIFDEMHGSISFYSIVKFINILI
jgi:hypothetical protein